MSRNKSNTKTGWKAKDKAYRAEQAKRRRANAERRASYQAAVAAGQVAERAAALGRGEAWPAEAAA